jgi:hypothetical protein
VAWVCESVILKWVLKEKVVNYIDLAQDGLQWRDLLKAVMKLRVA